MNLRGRWAARGQTVAADGTVTGPPPPGDRIGFHLTALVSPFKTWGDTVSRFLSAKGRPETLMVWTNQDLAQPFEEQTGSAKAGDLERRREADRALPPRERVPLGTVPAWTLRLLAAADTQRDHFWWTVRAFGPGRRGRLVACGRADDFGHLRRVTLDADYPIHGARRLSARPERLAIDSGGGLTEENTSRTEEVYRFAEADPACRVLCYKGSRKRTGSEQWRGQTHVRQGRYSTVELRYVRPDHYKNQLARLVADPGTEPCLWELPAETPDEYLRQMTAEHKVVVWHGRVREETWQKRSLHAANHLWDCEVLQLALADYLGVQFAAETDTLAGRASAAADPDGDPAHRIAEYLLG
jgi:phage terminase large subunit GpA-like protein